MLAASPLFRALREALDGAVVRPSSEVGTDYNRVSYAFANAVHTVLAGQSDAESSLRALERQLRRLKRRGNWGPSDSWPRFDPDADHKHSYSEDLHNSGHNGHKKPDT